MVGTAVVVEAFGGDLPNNNDKDKGKKRLSIRKEVAKAYKRIDGI